MSFQFKATTLAMTIAAVIATSAPLAAQDQGLVRYGTTLVKPDGIVPGKGRIVIPESSLVKPGDNGTQARTHHLLLIPDVPAEPPRPGAAAVTVTSLAETPASLACVYRLVPQTMGCDPTTFFKVATGGSRTIAIVDAFHNPTVIDDLKFFSNYFNLPAPNIQVIYCSATLCSTAVKSPPPRDTGWSEEIALDVQAAHAMAPHAKIVLVEAFSSSFADLMRAVDRAKLIVGANGGQVSNSYGGSDSFSHLTDDNHFIASGVVFFASTGDHKGGTTTADVEWPSTSPNVVAVGGTQILRNSNSNAFINEKAWIDAGGGISANEPRPNYQNGIQSRVGSVRGVPDLAADASPDSGMWVRCSPTSCGAGPWIIVGGTSLATPLLAGMTNAAGHFRLSSKSQLIAVYTDRGTAKFSDIHAGKCGNGAGGAFVDAIAGWDRCTGIGSPKGLGGL